MQYLLVRPLLNVGWVYSPTILCSPQNAMVGEYTTTGRHSNVFASRSRVSCSDLMLEPSGRSAWRPIARSVNARG
jgi:hypothetical protein